jgi:hypothetical protein
VAQAVSRRIDERVATLIVALTGIVSIALVSAAPELREALSVSPARVRAAPPT